jgi:hypothetical protein
MNPNISVEKIDGADNRFTITYLGEGNYLRPGTGVIISYDGMDYVITEAEVITLKPPTYEVTANQFRPTDMTAFEARIPRLTQVTIPNPDIPCTPGWCLVYVRETFGIGPKHPTATAGWQASNSKHADRNFPNAWVPVWFSLSDEPAGHVALRQPDGSIWSSSHPTRKRPIHHDSLEDILSYYGKRMTYLGWTEDLEGRPVVQQS